MDIVNFQLLLDNSILPQSVAQFPVTYRFRLKGLGLEHLRCQFGTSSVDYRQFFFTCSLIMDKNVIAGLLNKNEITI